jgi:hypothetical protein
MTSISVAKLQSVDPKAGQLLICSKQHLLDQRRKNPAQFARFEHFPFFRKFGQFCSSTCVSQRVVMTPENKSKHPFLRLDGLVEGRGSPSRWFTSATFLEHVMITTVTIPGLGVLERDTSEAPVGTSENIRYKFLRRDRITLIPISVSFLVGVTVGVFLVALA